MFLVTVGPLFVAKDNTLTANKNQADRFALHDAYFVASSHDGGEIVSA